MAAFVRLTVEDIGRKRWDLALFNLERVIVFYDIPRDFSTDTKSDDVLIPIYKDLDAIGDVIQPYIEYVRRHMNDERIAAALQSNPGFEPYLMSKRPRLNDSDINMHGTVGDDPDQAKAHAKYIVAVTYLFFMHEFIRLFLETPGIIPNNVAGGRRKVKTVRRRRSRPRRLLTHRRPLF